MSAQPAASAQVFGQGFWQEARLFISQWRRRKPAPGRLRLETIMPVVLVGLAACLLTGWLIDVPVALLARELPVWVNRLFSRITLLGASGYIFALSALMALVAIWLTGRSTRPVDLAGLRILAGRALLVFTVAATSGIASQILKYSVGRARPRLLEKVGAFHFDPLNFTSVQASFPSGHTITAFAIAWTLGVLVPTWRIPLFIVAILVGISRVAIGAHYPADVLVGAAIGVISAILTTRAFASRRLVLECRAGQIVPRGRGLAVPALRATLGAGKAQRQK